MAAEGIELNMCRAPISYRPIPEQRQYTPPEYMKRPISKNLFGSADPKLTEKLITEENKRNRERLERYDIQFLDNDERRKRKEKCNNIKNLNTDEKPSDPGCGAQCSSTPTRNAEIVKHDTVMKTATISTTAAAGAAAIIITAATTARNNERSKPYSRQTCLTENYNKRKSLPSKENSLKVLAGAVIPSISTTDNNNVDAIIVKPQPLIKLAVQVKIAPSAVMSTVSPPSSHQTQT